jgi:hypothetical protein
MQPQISNKDKSERYLVKDEVAAKLLVNPKSFRYFEPFIGNVLSANQVAKTLGCRLDTLLYWIKKFIACGLLKIEHIQERQGRAIKYYRAISEAFFVPFELTPYADFEDRLVEYHNLQDNVIRQGLNQVAGRDTIEGIDIYRDNHRQLHNTIVFQFPQSTFNQQHIGCDFGGALFLTLEDAQILQRSLLQLWQQHRIKSDMPEAVQDGSHYYLRISLVEFNPQ